MRLVHLGERKYLAGGGLALAFFLELCGCNLVTDCDHVREMRIASVEWTTLLDRCATCLTSREVDTLAKRHVLESQAGSPASTGEDETVQDALSIEGGLPFDEPRPGQGPATTSTPNLAPPQVPQPHEISAVPWPIPESVFFVFKDSPEPNTQRTLPIATSFVVSVPNMDHRTLARFLVTARHVVDPIWAHCADTNPSSIEIRLNRRTGGVGYERISLETSHFPQFITPADEVSDLAIIRLDRALIPNLEAYKFMDVPFHLLPTASDLQTISTEQEITTAGLPFQALPEAGSYPVSHAGMLSRISSEAVNTRCGQSFDLKALHLWFIRGGVPRGFSGAPVYTSMSRTHGRSQTPILLGIQAMAWPDKGVAGITPAAVLGDLIQHALNNSKQQMDFYRGPNP